MGQLHEVAVLTVETSAAQISTTYTLTYWFGVQAKICSDSHIEYLTSIWKQEKLVFTNEKNVKFKMFWFKLGFTSVVVLAVFPLT